MGFILYNDLIWKYTCSSILAATCVIGCVAYLSSALPCSPLPFSPLLKLRHFFVANDLHFGVYALDHLAADEEVTLPFDFQHEKW